MQTYEILPRPWNDASTQSDQDVFDHAYDILLQAGEQTIGTTWDWDLESGIPFSRLQIWNSTCPT
jgi:hypothetical protein